VLLGLSTQSHANCIKTHYGGWHSGATGDDGFLNHVCHSGDGETHTGWGERFEHPTKTWACATHKQFTMQAVAVAIAEVKMAGNTGPPHAMYLILRPC